MKKLWGGRFSEATDASVEAFTESVSFDWRLWPYDIRGSIAHVRMLGRQKVLSGKDVRTIVAGLKEIAREIEDGEFVFLREREDVHMNIEARLIEKVGAAGGRLHTGRSRNDQVATDLRLYLREQTDRILAGLTRFRKALLRAAKRHINVILPGYTHLQRAQPVRLAHHWLAYFDMFGRDIERFTEARARINRLPLGSAALAGTTFPLDRDFVARQLGFQGIIDNSMDAVSDRDFVVEFLAAASIVMMHLSRLSEELILWTSGEFAFADLPDAFATGSSIMPQKKNPDVPELVRGKTGRVYGHLFGMLTVLKGLPLTYNRDLQEDKEPLFDSVDTVVPAVELMARIVSRLKVDGARMREAARGGFSTATDLADYLVTKGMPFRDAHEVAGKAVALCMERRCTLEELPLEDYQALSDMIGEEVFQVVALESSVDRRSSRGGTARQCIMERIQQLEREAV